MTASPAFLAIGFGMPELVIVLVIILLLFGGAKLPSLAKGLGQSIKEFKKASKDTEADSDQPLAEKKPEAGKKTHDLN